MKNSKPTYLFSVAGIAAITLFSFCNTKASKKEVPMINEKGFAVVELFTSEGCSSCPAAEEVFIKLAKEFPEHVYFLAYHVDYWDYIGWKDEFASGDYTKLQNKYAEAFRLNSIYTPQAVVNGEKELVGSRESQLRSLIQEQLKVESSSNITLVAKKDSNNISVSYKVSDPAKASLNIALIQKMATTNVKRGENEGRKLNHINIVRSLKTVSLNKEANSTVDFKILPGLLAKDLKVIAFIQNQKDLKIIGAAEAVIE